MKYLIAIALLAFSSAYAQSQNCIVTGNLVQCQGSMVDRANQNYQKPDFSGLWQAQQEQARQWQLGQLRYQCLNDARVTDKSVCYRIGN
jgi:hypothetical protein